MSECIWKLLEPSLHSAPHTAAWVCRGEPRRVVSYQTLHQASLTLAAQLRDAGVKPGDSVAIGGPNSPEWGCAALAAWKIGASVAPLAEDSAAHQAARMQDLSPKLLLDAGAKHKPANRIEVTLDHNPQLAAREAAQPLPAADCTALRIRTSGSTGRPKIVRISQANLTDNVQAARKLIAFPRHENFLALLPFAHAFGLMGTMLLPLALHATIVLPRKLAAQEILAALPEENITLLIGVPRLFRNVMLGLEKRAAASPLFAAYLNLLRAAPAVLRGWLNAPLRRKMGGRITAWVSGGAALDGEVLRYFHALGLPLRQGYGLTETSPLACLQDAFDTAPDSVGRAVPGVDLRIDAPDANGCGEIWIRGHNIMQGYEDPEQNAAALENGWFKTGDIGRLDEQGRLYITGRSKRLIVTQAGKNIHPEELEALLERAPEVAEAAVVEHQARPAAVLCMREADPQLASSQARKVLDALNAELPSHEQIPVFRVVAELPHTPVGKIALTELPGLFDEPA